jgi:hypothetical protein
MSLNASLASAARDSQRLFDALVRVIRPVSQEVRLADRRQQKRLVDRHEPLPDRQPLESLLDQRERLSRSPTGRIRQSQGRADDRQPISNNPRAAQFAPALEYDDSLLDVTLAQVEARGPVKCQAKTEGVIELLGDLDCLICVSSGLREGSHFGQAQGEECAGVYGRQRGLPEALTNEITGKRRDTPSQSVRGDAILAGTVRALPTACPGRHSTPVRRGPREQAARRKGP